jgi:hypothetical protein
MDVFKSKSHFIFTYYLGIIMFLGLKIVEISKCCFMESSGVFSESMFEKTKVEIHRDLISDSNIVPLITPSLFSRLNSGTEIYVPSRMLQQLDDLDRRQQCNGHILAAAFNLRTTCFAAPTFGIGNTGHFQALGHCHRPWAYLHLRLHATHT